MTDEEIITWLLEGDIAIRYQVYRDLIGDDKASLQKRIAQEGWGAALLNCRLPNGHWGRSFYQPKWTSTHYTLLDLKNLNLAPANAAVTSTLNMIFDIEKGPDGGLNPSKDIQQSDVCINGMALNYACYFKVDNACLTSVIDFLLLQQLEDGGFNCRFNRRGAVHSSLHSTLSVLEGIYEYEHNGYTYRLSELKAAKHASREFILRHRLFRSDKTGNIINSNFLKFYYPTRWYYDVLRAMDYFQRSNTKYDLRMNEALEVILQKRTNEGRWQLASKHPGQTHFDMETAGKPSRWNTLRALRVLSHYRHELSL